jgi:protein TonB
MDIERLQSEDIQYAINEMYARHGAEFKDPKVTAMFQALPWYEPYPGRTYEATEQLFTDTERANVQLLGALRAYRRANTPAQPIAPEPTRPVAAAPLKGVISAPRPEYPFEARRQRITGSGVCVLYINKNGTVTNAVMAESTGSRLLDDAAVSAFRRWRFRPGSPSRVRMPITFTLRGAEF